jgi:uncharacterized membrane protein
MTTYIRPERQYRQAQANNQRSLGDLFGDLSQKAGLLARQEIQLAKVEMKQKATEATAEIGTIVIGGFLANAALLALVTALIVALTEFMALWLSALIVGVVIAVIAGLLIGKGVTALKEMNVVPEQTVSTLQEDKEWLTQQLSQ